jgi:tetratricopeptide (TPR) repeat protein
MTTSTKTASLSDYLARIKQGDAAMKQIQFADAIVAFREAIEMRPDMYEGHFKLGTAYMLSDELLPAVKSYTEAYNRQPKDMELLLRLSELCYRMEDYSKAAQFLAEVLMLNDRYLPALLVLPELLTRIGRYDEAIELMKAAIPVQPHVPELWTAAGIAVQATGDFERARIFYREAINLDPKSTVAKHNLELLDRKIADAAGSGEKAGAA